MPITVGETCIVTDVDRTLYKTGVAALKLLMAVEQILGVETSEIAQEIDGRRNRGETTQITDWIIGKGAASYTEDIFQRFVDITRPEEVMYEDVPPYVDAIEESELVTAVLLTMGPHMHQEAKICTMGLQGKVPYVVVDPATTEKAEVKDWQVRSWVDTSTGLIVPKLSRPIMPRSSLTRPVKSKDVIMIEDKYEAFGTGSSRPQAGQQPGIGGFWVDRPEERRKPLQVAERAQLPPSIEYAEGLGRVVDFINNPEEFTKHPMHDRFHQALRCG